MKTDTLQKRGSPGRSSFRLTATLITIRWGRHSSKTLR